MFQFECASVSPCKLTQYIFGGPWLFCKVLAALKIKVLHIKSINHCPENIL